MRLLWVFAIWNNIEREQLKRAAPETRRYSSRTTGGQRAASLYSLIATAKLNGLDPAFYLRTVLATIAEHPINRIEELLPWSIANSIQPESSLAA